MKLPDYDGWMIMQIDANEMRQIEKQKRVVLNANSKEAEDRQETHRSKKSKVSRVSIRDIEMEE
jgi:hypothetical protein